MVIKNGDLNGKGIPMWPAFSIDNPVTMVINEKRIEAIDMKGDYCIFMLMFIVFKSDMKFTQNNNDYIRD